jgi:hypothetical protein
VTSSVETLISAVERLPAVTVQIHDEARSARVHVGARQVASIDLRDGGLLVHAPVERRPILQQAFPSCRPAADGIAFDLADPRGQEEGLAALRGRVNAERLGWQLDVASP